MEIKIYKFDEIAKMLGFNTHYFINHVVREGKIEVVVLSPHKRVITENALNSYLMENSGKIKKGG